MGQVRAILLTHLRHTLGQRQPEPAHPDDPLDAGKLTAMLTPLGATRMQCAGRDYARLWGQTFPGLTKQLRGRPEEALRIFSQEVYPYLRLDPSASRVEAGGTMHLPTDLPAPYHAGLVEGFLHLAGAEATCRPDGAGRFHVTYRVHRQDRLAHLVQRSAALRVHWVLTAFLAALLGVALGAGYRGSPWIAGATLLGVVGAQLGANALHDAASRPAMGPLFPRPAQRRTRYLQAVSWFGIAAACGAYLTWAAQPTVPLFILYGLVASLAYRPLARRGLGPLTLGVVHGPLIVLGAAHIYMGTWIFHPRILLAAVTCGVWVAAIAYLDDLIDRPLDQAAGKRSLVLRLPGTGHVVRFAILLALGLAGLGASAVLWLGSMHVLWVFPLALAAFLITRWLQGNLDDPPNLAPARLATLTFASSALMLLAATVALGWLR